MKYQLILISLLLTSCGKNGDTRTRLYVYGDSISAGLDHPSWPELIATNYNYALVNHSVGGTAIEWSNQAPLMLTESFIPGSVIAFSPGVNDAVLFQQDPTHIQLFKDYIHQVVTRLATLPVRAYIGTPIQHATYSDSHFGPNADVNAYATIIRDELATTNANNVTLVEFNTCFIPTVNNTLDGLHPNAIGYNDMYNCFKENK